MRLISLLIIAAAPFATSFTSIPRCDTTATLLRLTSQGNDSEESPPDDNEEIVLDKNRRDLWFETATRATFYGLLPAAVLTSYDRQPVWAAQARSRSEGYDVQKAEEEWKSQLSQMQYYVLREGGTERPGYSVLEKEYREGIYKCAGCGTDLFASADKFSSGTGWPSFARGISTNVETAKVDPVTATLSGAELRCQTCGGHLGDIFQDGFLFVGTEAFKTGKRFCIDGAALVFVPSSSSAEVVRGDIQQKPKEPSWMSPPTISPRSRDDLA